MRILTAQLLAICFDHLQSRDYQVNQFTEEMLESYYRLHIPTARKAYTKADKLDLYSATVYEKIEQLTFADLRKVVKQAANLNIAILDDSVSHDFFLVRPSSRYRFSPEIVIPTRHLYKELERRYQSDHNNAAAELYELFLDVPNTRVSAGYALETLVHAALPGGREWRIHTMSRSNRGSKNAHLKPTNLNTASDPANPYTASFFPPFVSASDPANPDTAFNPANLDTASYQAGLDAASHPALQITPAQLHPQVLVETQLH